MKKIILVMLILMMAFGSITLFAQAAEDSSDALTDRAKWKSELNDWSGKTLKIIMVADPFITAFQKLIPEFEATTGAKVEVSSYGYDQTHEKQVLEASQKSDEYDVIVLDSPWVGEFCESGFVEDLTPWIAKTDSDVIAYDDYFKVFTEVADWKGEIAGLPFSPYFITYYYRSDLFEKEGLTPPKTYDEWLAIADYFTENPDYPNMYGMATNNQQGSPLGQAYFEYIWNFGGKPFKSMYPGSSDMYGDMTPQFDSPESIAVVELFKEALKYQPEGALGFAWDERTQLFASGRAAEVSSFNLRAPIYIDPNRSTVDGKFATTVVPSAEGHDPVTPVGGWVLGMNSYSKNKDIAWDFIKWFASPEVHKVFVDYSGVGARYSAMNDADLKAKYWWFDTITEAADLGFADCRPRIPEAHEIMNTVGIYVSRALTGELTTEQAMIQLNGEMRDLLGDRYNMSN